MPSPAEEAAWADERSWTFPGVYFAPRDARLFVPKRPLKVLGLELEMGWTLNFADRRAVPTFLALLTLPVLALQLLPRRHAGGRRS